MAKKFNTKDILDTILFALDISKVGVWAWEVESQKFIFSHRDLVFLGHDTKLFSDDSFKLLDFVHPNDREAVLTSSKKCEYAYPKSFEYKFRMKNVAGQYRWIKSIGKVSALNKKKQAILIVGTIQDVTESKKAEILLRNRERRFRMLSNTAKEGVFIHKNDIIVDINTAVTDILGYTRKDLVGKNFKELFSSKTTQMIEKYVEHGVPYYYEVALKNKEGKGIVLEVIGKPYDKDLRIIIFSDITERKRTEKELQKYHKHLETLVSERTSALFERSNELEKTIKKFKATQNQLIQSEKMASLGVLVAGIAHELNNPLTFIITGAEAIKILLEDILEVINKYGEITESNAKNKIAEVNVLKEEYGFNQSVKEMIKLIDNINIGADQSTEIVKGLRSFSRLDGGEVVDYDIHQSINSSLLLLNSGYKYQIKIIKNFNKIPTIECYPLKLNQVFINLINNAIQSIDGKGEIQISTTISKKYKGKFVEISIKDTGCGIPKNIQNRIYEPFFTTKEVGKGTGLGLSISLGIIKDHHGFIEVESQLKKGTTFTVYLPISLKN